MLVWQGQCGRDVYDKREEVWVEGRRFVVAFVWANQGVWSNSAAQPVRLSLETAHRVAAAPAFAEQNRWTINIVVVDAAGHRMYLERGDGVPLANLEVAIAQARWAAPCRTPTRVLPEQAAEVGLYVPALPNLIPSEEGIAQVTNDGGSGQGFPG